MAYSSSTGLMQIQNAGTSTWVTVSASDYIAYESYKVTINTMDLDSYRSETGVLIRNVLSHKAAKIEFNTPLISSTKLQSLLTIIKNGYIDATARKMKIKYYDPETDGYKTGTFYMADPDYGMRHIDGNTINYQGVRFAFIEY